MKLLYKLINLTQDSLYKKIEGYLEKISEYDTLCSKQKIQIEDLHAAKVRLNNCYIPNAFLFFLRASQFYSCYSLRNNTILLKSINFIQVQSKKTI